MSQRRNEGKNTMAVTTTTPFHVVMHGVPPYCRPPAPTTVVAYPPPPNAATTLATGNLCQCHAPPARDLNMKITRKITNPSRSGRRSRVASSRWGKEAHSLRHDASQMLLNLNRIKLICRRLPILSRPHSHPSQPTSSSR